MLGYISKNKPDCLSNYKTSKVSFGNLNIYFLATCVDIFKPPENNKIIKINDSLSVYTLANEIDIGRIKKDKIIGNEFEMGDGQRYSFPKLRVFPSGTELATRLKLTENGEEYLVKPCHLRAWEAGDRLWRYLIEKEAMTDAEMYDILATIMQINYNVTIWDLKCYGLLDENVTDIIEHLLDIRTFERHLTELDELKKNR
jgi:hypothetical protein